MIASKIIIGIVAFSSSMLAQSVVAANAERGKLLYLNSCTKCHTSQAHIRNNRKVTSIGGITAQVSRWVGNNKLKWTDEEIADVVHYLNVRYYHFTK